MLNTKEQFVSELAKKVDATKVSMRVIYDEFINLIHREIKENGEVRVSGIGRFVVKTMAARRYRSIVNGKMIKVKSKKAVRLRQSRKLKDLV